MDLRDGNKNSHVELFNKNEILEFITTLQTNISNRINKTDKYQLLLEIWCPFQTCYINMQFWTSAMRYKSWNFSLNIKREMHWMDDVIKLDLFKKNLGRFPSIWPCEYFSNESNWTYLRFSKGTEFREQFFCIVFSLLTFR